MLKPKPIPHVYDYHDLNRWLDALDPACASDLEAWLVSRGWTPGAMYTLDFERDIGLATTTVGVLQTQFTTTALRVRIPW